MIIEIPGREKLEIKNVLLDYNGTIAEDGELKECVKKRVIELHNKGLSVYVLTADTHGTVKAQCKDLPLKIEIFDRSDAARHKRAVVEKLGRDTCISMGNGFNDGEMFEASVISVAVMGDEGCSVKSMLKADVVCRAIEDALDLLIKPKRLIATLRG